MFVTDRAVELFNEDNMEFRDAYRHIKYNYQELESRKAIDSLKKRVSPGATGNLFLGEIEGRLGAL